MTGYLQVPAELAAGPLSDRVVRLWLLMAAAYEAGREVVDRDLRGRLLCSERHLRRAQAELAAEGWLSVAGDPADPDGYTVHWARGPG